MTIQLGYDAKHNYFTIRCPMRVNYLAKGMPDRKWSKKRRCWYGPALRKNIEYLNAVCGPQWEVSPEARERLSTVDDVKARDKNLTAMPAWYPYRNPPLKHQATTLDKAVGLDFYALLFDQGLGKTYTAIQLACVWRMAGLIDSVLVICPTAITLVWDDEVADHAPISHDTHVMVSGKTGTSRFFRFAEEKNDFPWLIAGVEALQNGAGYEKVTGWCVGRKVAVIVDESSSIKNWKANRTERVDAIARMDECRKRLILSGTSISEGVENWYSQYHFLEPNIVGYDNFYSFRNQYCVTVNILIDEANPEGPSRSMIVDYQNIDELVKAVSFCTTRYEKDDVLDLPPKVFQTRIVQPSPEQKKAFKELAEEGRTLIEEEDILCTRAITVLLRMQQITGGFYPVDDPFNDINAKPIPGPNPKLLDMEQWLGEISGRSVIWCNFRAEHALICQRLDELGISYVPFIGGMTKDERKEVVDRYQSGSVQCFVSTYAGAKGLTLTKGTDVYYYSRTFSAENDAQSQDRTHRIGTVGTVTYTTPIMRGSPDSRLVAALRRKNNQAHQVYDQLRMVADE